MTEVALLLDIEGQSNNKTTTAAKKCNTADTAYKLTPLPPTISSTSLSNTDNSIRSWLSEIKHEILSNYIPTIQFHRSVRYKEFFIPFVRPTPTVSPPPGIIFTAGSFGAAIGISNGQNPITGHQLHSNFNNGNSTMKLKKYTGYDYYGV